MSSAQILAAFSDVLHAEECILDQRYGVFKQHVALLDLEKDAACIEQLLSAAGCSQNGSTTVADATFPHDTQAPIATVNKMTGSDGRDVVEPGDISGRASCKTATADVACRSFDATSRRLVAAYVMHQRLEQNLEAQILFRDIIANIDTYLEQCVADAFAAIVKKTNENPIQGFQSKESVFTVRTCPGSPSSGQESSDREANSRDTATRALWIRLLVMSLFFRARLEDFLKNSAVALEDLNRAIALHPLFSSCYNNRGLLLQNYGKDFEAAQRDFEKAIELSPRHALFICNLGLLHEKRGNHDLALQLYDRAISTCSNNSEGFFRRAYLRDVVFSQQKEALADYSAAIQLNPQYADALNNYALIVQEIDPDGATKALDAFTRALAIKPKSTLYWRNRGNLYRLKIKDYDKALQDYTMAINLDPKDAKAWNARGVLREECLKQYDLAISDYSKALEVDPSQAIYHTNIALCFEAKQDFESALKSYRAAAELDPKDAFCLFRQAFILDDKLDRYFEALKLYCKIVELGTNNVDPALNNRSLIFKDHLQVCCVPALDAAPK